MPRRYLATRSVWASTSARIGALRIDPSSGADTSSARIRGGGRPAELKVVTRSPEDRNAPLFYAQCHQEGGNVRQGRHLPAKSSTPLSKASRDVDQLWLQNWRAHEEGLQDKRESSLDSFTFLDFCWHAKTRGTCLMCHSSEGALRDFPSVPAYSSSDNEGEVRPLSAPLAFGATELSARRTRPAYNLASTA